MTIVQLTWVAAVFGATACLSLLLTPLVIRAAAALRLYDSPDGVRRLHDSPVPRLGGVAVYLSAAAMAAVVIYLGAKVFWPDVGITPQQWRTLTGVIIGSGLLFLVGLLDDVRGLPPSVKFAAQLVAASVAWFYGVRLFGITLGYGVGVQVGLLSAPLTVLWIVGVTNAFNFIDGLNGLAGGIAVVACATMVAVGLSLGNIAVIVPAVALAGALVGFLRYNFPAARIFLGDAGTMSVGFLLAVLLKEASEVPGPSVLVAVPILALCVPLLDVSLAILRRWLRGVPLTGADARHIHHRLIALGLSQKRTAVVLWCLAAAMASFGMLIALTAPYVATSIAIASLVGLSILVIYGTNLLSYDELIVAGEVLFTAPSRFRRVISDQILANDLTARIQSARAVDEVSSLLTDTAPRFGFLRMELIRESRSSRLTDDEVFTSWAWKLEYPLRPLPEGDDGPIYKLAIWCSAANNVRPYGAERAAKIIAPSLERWLLSRSADLNTPQSGMDYGLGQISARRSAGPLRLWKIRSR